MSITLGIVMDPIEDINFKKDSSLAMLWAAKRKGWSIKYMEQSDIYLRDGKIRARMADLDVAMDENHWFNRAPYQDESLTVCDAILMRKDPPFDNEFLYTTYLLAMAEKEGVLVANRTQSLREFNEKLYATHFPECCPPVLVSRSAERLKAFYAEHKDVIFKPLDGMGGTSIYRVDEHGLNLGVIIETLTNQGQQTIMAQRYIPEIVDGDKRILMIDGKPLPYALARIPKKGETRGNLAAGGRGEGRALTERDLWICDKIGPTLVEKGLYFVGLDVIGDYLTEINVTSPTCIRELDNQYGLDIGMDFINCIEGHLARR